MFIVSFQADSLIGFVCVFLNGLIIVSNKDRVSSVFLLVYKENEPNYEEPYQ